MLVNEALGSALFVSRWESSLYGQYLTSDVLASPPSPNVDILNDPGLGLLRGWDLCFVW